MNGAESLVRTLLASDLDVCFTNPGTSEMHFVAALDSEPGMRSVLALHEIVATGAADGYYRMSGRPASTLLHLGPGLANGLSNLHNAKKAGSGIVNIVGEHAIPHIALDAPLTSDIEGIARPVSHWVHTSTSAADVGKDAAAAVAAARVAPGQIATLVLPGDTAWNPGGVEAAPIAVTTPPAPDAAAVKAAAETLRQEGALLLLGGAALGEEALENAGRIAAATGCGLMTEWSNARLERGAGRVAVNRIPYVVELATAALAPFGKIVLAGSRPPVAFFAYPDKPGVLSAPGTEFTELATAEMDVAAALAALAEELDCTATAPQGIAAVRRPGLPTGPITPDTIAAVLGAHIPENAIIVDESITTGRAFFGETAGAPPHTWLNNRGGSIGLGLPLAVGAAIAAPDRKVIALEGDGSAMYSLQALWTMARENLDVTILVFANRTYKILLGELRNVGVANPGPRAVDMMTLDRPALGWVEMARGMGVEGVAVEESGDLAAALADGLASDGPYLVEVLF
ncbi:MAG: acetolactate synthase large subunit [Pseudomonadota bacterium]